MRMYDRPLWSLTAAGISLGDGLGPPPAAGPLSFRPPAQYDPGDGRMVPTRQGRSARRSSRGQSLYHARTTRWRSFADGTGSHSIPRRNSPRAPGQTDPVPKQPEGARVLPDPAPKHARGRRVISDPVPKQPQGAGSYPTPRRNMPEGAGSYPTPCQPRHRARSRLSPRHTATGRLLPISHHQPVGGGPEPSSRHPPPRAIPPPAVLPLATWWRGGRGVRPTQPARPSGASTMPDP